MDLHSGGGTEKGSLEASKLAAGRENVVLAQRFQTRALELGKSGVFGSIRTRNAALQNAYSLLMSLLDNPSVPFLIFGEKGSGKRRHVDEFLVAQNFYLRLLGRTSGELRVFRGDFINEGFSQLMRAPNVSAEDLIYIERVDELSMVGQKELLLQLAHFERLSEAGLAVPRVIAGTDRALSLLVLRKEFDRELFAKLTAFALFLPALNERSEDLPALVQSLVAEIGGEIQSPPTWLVDHFSRQIWPENLDELKRLLKSMLAKNANIQTWKWSDLPPSQRGETSGSFKPGKVRDVSKDELEKKKLKQALLKHQGDRTAAAKDMALSRTEMLEKLVIYGLR